jgi:DNA helicase-2/ATP-dependent DNA helicase PcrA
MPSTNRIIVASAGSGKTTTIIDHACSAPSLRAALVTYTMNNTAGIERLVYEKMSHVPSHLTISTWYSFLLRHFVRPYQRALHPDHVKRLHFHQGISAPYSKQENIPAHYFGKTGCMYVDKVSKFACQLIQTTGGLPIARLEEIFDQLYIDEVQDLAGWDLELVEMVMKSKIAVTLVGDHRQATFSTNSAHKNKKYAGANIISRFGEWKKGGLCDLEFQNISHRCVQPICDFADQLHPDMPKTTSLNVTSTGHDGVFAIRECDVGAYRKTFNPQTLRYSRASKNLPGQPINYGAAKGMTFHRTLIYPNGPLQKFLTTEKPVDAGKDIAKIYVAITRARQSSAIVVENKFIPLTIPIFQPLLSL